MGWACGINSEGRQVGYAVQATCDHPGCKAKIDRGLSYICGGYHDSDHGCGKFFCGDHRHVTVTGPETVSLCRECLKAYENQYPDEDEPLNYPSIDAATDLGKGMP